MQCTAVYWVWVGMSRFVAQTRSVCSRVLSAVWSGPVRMRGQRFCVLTDTDPAPRSNTESRVYPMTRSNITFFAQQASQQLSQLCSRMSATEKDTVAEWLNEVKPSNHGVKSILDSLIPAIAM